MIEWLKVKLRDWVGTNQGCIVVPKGSYAIISIELGPNCELEANSLQVRGDGVVTFEIKSEEFTKVATVN